MERIVRDRSMHIYIVDVNRKFDNKPCPVLILAKNGGNHLSIYNITSKNPYYKYNKSGYAYFSITEWKEAGLNKPSWIDTNTIYNIKTSDVENGTFVGRLQDLDQARLLRFLVKRHKLND